MGRGVTAAVLDELEEKGEIDDRSFAEEWVRGKALGGKDGEKLIRKQLLERGVAPGVIEEALGQGLPRESSLEAARTLAEKKMRDKGDLTPRERKRIQDSHRVGIGEA